MTKFAKWLGGPALALALGVMLFGVSGILSATGAAAETPPNPPARFGGTVKVDGATPPTGTVIEARVGSVSCGVSSVTQDGRYIVEVKAFDPGANPNCGTFNDATSTGSVVTFYVGGKLANETGIWKNFQFNELNLTVTTPTPTPSASASPSGSATATTTPRPPVTGSVEGSDDSAMLFVFAAIGLGALAFGVGGVTVARRSR